MKLIYIVNARIPTEKAHGIQIMKMCEAFSRQGFKVELVVPKRRNPITADPFEYYQIDHKFLITRLFCFDLTRFGGRFFFRLQSLSFSLSTIVFLAFKKKGAVLYTREYAHFWPKFLTDKFLLFIETHFFWPDKIRRYLRAFAKARGVIVVTKSYQEILQEKYGVSAEKILTAPDGVDAGKFKIQKSKVKIREELGLRLDKKIVLYSGNFFAWKGVYILADAAKFLDDNCLIVFVGGSSYELEKFRESLAGHLVNNILLVGHKPPAEIPKYLAAADVLVLPNSGKSDVSRYYTSPLKLFEYMAGNRPIVASDLPSIREVLNEENARLVAPDDPQALAYGIEEILSDKILAEKLTAQAKSEIEQYTWQKRAEKISAFIEARSQVSI